MTISIAMEQLRSSPDGFRASFLPQPCGRRAITGIFAAGKASLKTSCADITQSDEYPRGLRLLASVEQRTLVQEQVEEYQRQYSEGNGDRAHEKAKGYSWKRNVEAYWRCLPGADGIRV